MPSAPKTSGDTNSGAAEVVDEARTSLLEAVISDLSTVVVESKLDPGHDFWVRVQREAWADVAQYFHHDQQCRYFDWLSAIDWKQSPFARSMDSGVDSLLAEDSSGSASSDSDPSGSDPSGSDSSGSDSSGSKFSESGADGYAGGQTRFQVIARVSSLSTGLSINLKADLPADDLTIATWINTYPGANWHEREAFEMFGINFAGHPKMQNLYLPTDFEGFPLRKDFPLVARMVKPWPGIVDVEPMPEVDAEPNAASAKPTSTKPTTIKPGTASPAAASLETAARADEAPATKPLGATTTNPEDGGVR